MTREINDQTPGRPGCDGNDRSRGMSKETDIASLRNAAQKVGGAFEMDPDVLIDLLDRLEQAEADAEKWRLLIAETDHKQAVKLDAAVSMTLFMRKYVAGQGEGK